MSEKTVNLTPHAKPEQISREYLKEQTQEFYGTLKKGDWFGEKGRRIGGELRDYLLSVALAIRPPKETMPSMNEKELDNAKLAVIVQLRIGMVAGAADGKLGRSTFEKIAKKLGMKLRRQGEPDMRFAKPIPVRDVAKEKICIPVVEDLEKYLDSKIGAEAKKSTAETKVSVLNNDPKFMALQLRTRAEVVKKIMAGRPIAGIYVTVSWKIQTVEDHAKELKANGLSKMQARQEVERVLNLPENRKLFTGLGLDAGTVAESAVSRVY